MKAVYKTVPRFLCGQASYEMAGANISLRRGGTFSRRKPGQRDFPPGKSPLSRKPAKWNFHFQSVSLTLCLVAFLVPFPIFAPLSFRRHEHAHPSVHRNTRGGSPPPNDGADVHRVYSARGTIERSRTKRYEVEYVRRGGNYQAHRSNPNDSPLESLFPLTRKIGLDNCRGRTTFPSSPLTLVFLPSFPPSFSLLPPPPSLVSTIFPAKVCQEGKCGKFGKESGSRRTIAKNPIILGRREDCNYRDYRIPKRSGGS